MSDRDELGASSPHEQERSDRQLAWLGESCRGRMVLDLGCGDGRVAAVVSPGASRYVALDQDREALARCGQVSEGAELLEADLRSPPLEGEHFERILCLGNTFCLLWDVDVAVAAMRCWRSLLSEDGVLVLDDIPQNLWPEIAEGMWINGVSEDDELQLVWAPDDAVMVLRRGSDIDPGEPRFRGTEQPMRIWTSGSLRLASRLAGFEPPQHEAEAGVLILRAARADQPG